MAVNGKLPDSELAPIAGGRLRRDAAAAWNAMNVEARQRGLELRPTGSRSSYRTHAEQLAFWELYRTGRGALAARPGTSNHGWGLAVDVPTVAMQNLINEIGAKYGWQKKWSDAPSEPWHFKWREGIWSGPDPGPNGKASKQVFTPPTFTKAPPMHVRHFSTRKNARHPDVKVWQQRMRDRGWNIAVNGIFDAASERVANKFKRQIGLKADGKIGRRAWKAAWTAPVT